MYTDIDLGPYIELFFWVRYLILQAASYFRDLIFILLQQNWQKLNNIIGRSVEQVLNINIEWIIQANYFFLVATLILIVYIFSRRIMRFFPELDHRILQNNYRKQTELILYEKKKRFRWVFGKIRKAALENVLLARIAKCGGDTQGQLIDLYEKSGLLNWRIKQLNSRSVWKRRFAADKLGSSLSREAVTNLIIALRDKDDDVRFIAAKGLGKVKAKGAIEYIASLLHDLPEERCAVIADILIDYGDLAVPALVQALADPQEKACYWAVRALAELDLASARFDKEAFVKKLEKLVKNKSARIRAYTTICLARTVSPEKTELLTRKLADKDPQVRACASQALAIINNTEAMQALIPVLADKDRQVSYAASRALLAYGPKVIDLLKKYLWHKNKLLRAKCQELLEEQSLNALA